MPISAAAPNGNSGTTPEVVTDPSTGAWVIRKVFFNATSYLTSLVVWRSKSEVPDESMSKLIVAITPLPATPPMSP